MEAQVQDMLKNEVIEPSSSLWSAPVELIPKKSKAGTPPLLAPVGWWLYK
jgi:hypothetical protein